MLRVDNISVPLQYTERELTQKTAKLLRVSPNAIRSLRLNRRAIDSRGEVHYVLSVLVSVEGEERILRRNRDKNVSRAEKLRYAPPMLSTPPALPPVVVGAGPAGLFAALLLAEAGAKPILLERGRKVEQRQADVQRFFETGVLDPASNVQFGEGGAGAFSDGKLNTGTKDPRHSYILHRLVDFGAPEDILYDAKPHVGTDKLHSALIAMRRYLIDHGADIRFSSQLTDIVVKDGAISAISVTTPEGSYTLPCEQLILAPGHSARDTFAMLHEKGLSMEPKAFAVGVRIEHKQSEMDAQQYREAAGNPALPASSYKLSCHLANGRGVFSFCVCPGGEVVAAASEEGRLVTNGMSEFARDKENINGGLLVSVTPEDFGAEGPLAGIAFQRKLEEDAFLAGGGGYAAPAQLVGDFLAGKPSAAAGHITPSYRPRVHFTDLRTCLPPFIADSLREALPLLDEKLPGFAAKDAVLTAVESRSSSPVRILRDETGVSSVQGLYPTGEGAGYAGGILSAAADGMRQAEALLSNYYTEKEKPHD